MQSHRPSVAHKCSDRILVSEITLVPNSVTGVRDGLSLTHELNPIDAGCLLG